VLVIQLRTAGRWSRKAITQKEEVMIVYEWKKEEGDDCL
jgi:hypothetical protein